MFLHLFSLPSAAFQKLSAGSSYLAAGAVAPHFDEQLLRYSRFWPTLGAIGSRHPIQTSTEDERVWHRSRIYHHSTVRTHNARRQWRGARASGVPSHTHIACSLGFSTTCQYYFSLTTNQPPATSP
jgi:hypothetical protein